MAVQFGPFVLDAAGRQLVRDGEVVHLSPKALNLLHLLVERWPAAVSKAELHGRLWPGIHVSDGSVAVVAAEIRAALGDNARQPCFVRTVHRFGYAFCGRVVACPAPSLIHHTQRQLQLTWGGKQVALPSGASTLGRGTEATIQFDAPDVSRCHARIHVSGPTVTIEDLGSKNGTYVAGERITHAVDLTVGTTFRLGPLDVTLRMTSGDTTTVALGSP